MDQAACMKLAAEHAVDKYVRSNTLVGIGTGRTANYATRRIAEHIRSGRLTNVTGVSTSEASSSLMKELGIPSREMDECVTLDVAIDGTDAFDDELNLIKGGGGALFREKLVELAAKQLVIVADESKRAKGHLLEAFKLPVEIVHFGLSSTIRRVYKQYEGVIKSWKLRENADGSVYKTDNNNVIMDICFAPTNLKQLDDGLKSIHGVVCSGLFIGMASAVVVARSDGSLQLLP
ncbi:ribose-5-phosphate isomerase 3 [Babesia gibsoni]|uniref:ribose-5-phosphate isomerase n=1 Tax=Babesia gibsoni TaxID=33632 RepID=A0AAD8UW54_BABGI|nr:ribose-5-phosphate isomerase 3 [Babesia gibsoni]